MTVLIVDDDQEDTEFFCDAVTAFDPSVECLKCNNPQHLSRFLALKPAIIFVDSYIGRVSGEDILRKINEETGSDRPKIVMYSGVFSPEQKRIYSELGCYAILEKSSSFKGLVQILADLLK
jgi:DNA-binding response OmpR family regulator